MAITGKKTEDLKEETSGYVEVVEDRQVRHVFRSIDRQLGFGVNENTGAVSVTWLNEYIASFLEEGFEILTADVVESSPEGYTMAYVLVK
jgi:hypothetical protein